MTAAGVYLSSDFDVLAGKPVQNSVQSTIETIYKPLVSIDQTDIEFSIPADNETYTDPNI